MPPKPVSGSMGYSRTSLRSTPVAPRVKIMKIDFSPYELVARADGRRRAGALLRVAFEDGVRGVADVHPWPEFGDAPLDRQLFALTQDRPEPLARRSLALARADGEARAVGRSLFEGLTIPPSHASLPFGFTTDDLTRVAAQGYDRVKLKGWDFSVDDLALFRASGLKFRLDFNARLERPAVERLLDDWGDLGWIDWLEDPCPYDDAAWNALRARARLALDFEQGGEAFDVRVVKPARDAPEMVPLEGRHDRKGETWGRGSGIAFTSYLDHPIGQLGAAWTAARAVAEGVNVETGGLVTHEVYEPTEFSRRLGVRNARPGPARRSRDRVRGGVGKAGVEDAERVIDLRSDANEVLLNPRMPEDLAGTLRARLVAVERLRGHVFLLTSGSTAASEADYKWVALSKRAILNSARAANEALGSDARDVWFHTLPEFHVGGLGIGARAELSGARVVRPTYERWDPARFAAETETAGPP